VPHSVAVSICSSISGTSEGEGATIRIFKSIMLTYFALQPIHLVCMDSRIRYLYIIAGNDEELEFQITPNGEVF
jgi:hypothetical protein